MPDLQDSLGDDHIDILENEKIATMINTPTSQRPGSKKLEYRVGRWRGMIFYQVTCIYYEPVIDGELDDDNQRAPIGTRSLEWWPLAVFEKALAHWRVRSPNKAYSATFLLPNNETKVHYDFPGKIEMNRNNKGSLVAILRKEGILAEPNAPFAPGDYNIEDEEHPGHLPAGLKSYLGKLTLQDYHEKVSSMMPIASEPFTLDDVVQKLVPPLRQIMRERNVST